MYLLCVILSPIVYGIANLIDKYIVSKRAVDFESYTVLTGWIHLSVGLCCLPFVDFRMDATSLLACSVCGAIYAAVLYLYYFLFSTEDAANVVGLEYTYPVVVAVLAYAFLNERMSGLAYLGMAFVVIGIVAMSRRMWTQGLKANPRVVFGLLGFVFLMGFYEFFIKVAADRVDGLAAFAINSIAVGVVVSVLLTRKQTRLHLRQEFQNLGYALIGECCTLLAILLLFQAMTRYPATIVSSIAAIQPLVVLLGERFFLSRTNIVKDMQLLPKLFSISFVILGVIVLVQAI